MCGVLAVVTASANRFALEGNRRDSRGASVCDELRPERDGLFVEREPCADSARISRSRPSRPLEQVGYGRGARIENGGSVTRRSDG